MTDTTKPDPLDGIMEMIRVHVRANPDYGHWTTRMAAQDNIHTAIQSAIERARADAIEQAAKACEAKIDEAEHKRATDRAREAMKSRSMRDQIDRLKHEAMVSVHNAVLQRSADAIRALGTTGEQDE
jgi:hypothetical protein